QDAFRPFNGLINGDLTFTQQRTQGVAVHVFHDHVRACNPGMLTGVRQLFLARIKDRNSVRMVQRGRSMSFAAEPRRTLWVSGQVRAHHFDGHGAAESLVAAQIDVGHSASTYQFADLVTAIDNSLLGHGFPYEALCRVSSARGWGSISTGSAAGCNA